jgi:two-component system, OmpR family, sensor histidine kinase KdpD
MKTVREDGTIPFGGKMRENGPVTTDDLPAADSGDRGVAFTRYGWTFLGVLFVTLAGKMLIPFFDLVNIALLYLLPVLVSAALWGRAPSFFAAFSGVLAFDFFFVPPVLSLTVSDIRYVFTFAVFLLVALVTGTMATRLRNELGKAREGERRTLALYSLSRKMAAENDLRQVSKMVIEKAAETIKGEVIMLVREPGSDALVEVAASPSQSTLPDEKERALVHWVLEHGRSAGKGTEIISEAEKLFCPVKAEGRTLAVLAVKPCGGKEAVLPEQQQLIEAFANLAAVGITRGQLAKEAEKVRWLAESERLHRALLDSISHDLRTPLASITGAVTGLLDGRVKYSRESEDVLLVTIRDGARQLNRFVANLLDMARLESGVRTLNKEWGDIEDVIGVALREAKETLKGHPLKVTLSPGLPLVEIDFALMVHVIINLLENGAKYSLPESGITIGVSMAEQELVLTVDDSGPPVPVEERDRIFDKFHRLPSTRHISGTGLGLSICRGIVEAHGGRIWVEPGMEGGNRFVFSLPAGSGPPENREIGREVEHGV